jgi:hypothetical protein
VCLIKDKFYKNGSPVVGGDGIVRHMYLDYDKAAAQLVRLRAEEWEDGGRLW